jgi:nucleotide-binding universal stress UspA family protein
MATQPATQPVGEILVGTDGSPTADEAVRRAGQAAALGGARLHIVTAVDGPARTAGAQELPPDLQWAATPGRRADQILERARDLVHPSVVVELHSVPGNAADVLLQLADELDVDLLVVGNKGMHGVGGYVRPTVPNRVSHRARCDVLIVATDGRAA